MVWSGTNPNWKLCSKRCALRIAQPANRDEVSPIAGNLQIPFLWIAWTEQLHCELNLNLNSNFNLNSAHVQPTKLGKKFKVPFKNSKHTQTMAQKFIFCVLLSNIEGFVPRNQKGFTSALYNLQCSAASSTILPRTYPISWSRTNAICVKVGSALVKSIGLLGSMHGLPIRCRVHNPFGPR